MTREEIETFVTETIRDGWDRDEMVKQITDKWEEDKQIAIDEAFIRGQHSMHPF